MIRLLKATVLAALVLTTFGAGSAVAGYLVRIERPVALDLADIGLTLPAQGPATSPEALASLVLRGDRMAADTLVAVEEPVWLAAGITNESPETRWVIYLRQADYSRVDLWTYDGGVLESHVAAGVGVAAEGAQPKFALGYEFPITLPRHETRTLVLRLEPITFRMRPPGLAPAALARADAARRRLVFPLVLGAFLGAAALHVVLFVRFGGLANLLFAGTVAAIVLDWFSWLGGPEDLGFGLTVEGASLLSSATWLSATFLLLTFCLNFFTAGTRAPASYAALLGLFALLVAAVVWVQSPDLLLITIQAFLLASAGLILANGIAAVRRGSSGARLALSAYGIALANELLAYATSWIPWLSSFGEWITRSIGIFDIGTLLSQIPVYALFSLALWERVRASNREREAAIRIERLKTAQLAQISHDIRSPLHAVHGAIAALAANSPKAGESLHHVDIVQSSVRSVVAMLDDMVALAKSGSASLPRHAGVNLRQVVADTVALARVEIGDRPVAMRTAVADGVPALVGGDGVAIRRVLGNLVSNAVHATGHGTVSVTVTYVDAPEAKVRFEVADTGSGISERRLADLFWPAAGADGRGTGLGLKVARRLVGAIGGTLQASSRLGTGTTVWFELPALPVAPARSTAADDDASTVPRLRLLLVEDDELAAAATAIALTVDNHAVTHARTAAQAIGLARELPFDLVLMDLGLDVGSGVDAVRAIRAMHDPARANVPIVVMTGDRGEAERARRTSHGVRSVLIKPFDVTELRRAVGDALGSSANAAPPSGHPAELLDELAAVLAPSALRALLATGRVEIATNHRALLAAVGASRLDDARRSAHRLASSAGVLGLEGLSTAARAAEAFASAEDQEALDRSIDEVRLAVEGALAELDRWLTPAMAQNGPR